MKVSIITPTYNSAATIKDTLFSVQQQSYENLEHIIVDGKSSDNTLNLLDHFGHTGPLLSEADSGIYDAMNKGVAMATGDIIGILNSDDFYPHAGVIDKVVKAFEDKNCDAVYGDLVYVDAHHAKKVLRKWIAVATKGAIFTAAGCHLTPRFLYAAKCMKSMATSILSSRAHLIMSCCCALCSSTR